VTEALTQAAWAAVRTDIFVAARFRRLKGHLGTKKAITTIAHSLIVAVWHTLTMTSTTNKLGTDYYDRWDP